MNMRDVKKKPETKPVSKKKPEPVLQAFSKKELLEIFNLLTAIAKLFEQERNIEKLERAEKTEVHVKRRAMMAKTVKAPLPKHLGRAIMAAQTWEQQDLLYRRLSAFCYETAKSFLNSGDSRNAHKWMTLSMRYSKLSMDPKKQITEEKLQELQDMLHEIEEHEKKDEGQH
jgi:hypothetical protein